jgi:hypothetical protein
LSSVTIKYNRNTGLRDCEIVIDAGDWNLDVWGTVTITLFNVSSYRIEELANRSAQVISTGVHLVEFDGKLGVELGDIPDPPKTLEKLLSSDLFVLGERVEITMSDELLQLF